MHVAPSRAKRVAIARPMPREAPVMRVNLLAREEPEVDEVWVEVDREVEVEKWWMSEALGGALLVDWIFSVKFLKAVGVFLERAV